MWGLNRARGWVRDAAAFTCLHKRLCADSVENCRQERPEKRIGGRRLDDNDYMGRPGTQSSSFGLCSSLSPLGRHGLLTLTQRRSQEPIVELLKHLLLLHNLLTRRAERTTRMAMPTATPPRRNTRWQVSVMGLRYIRF